MKRLLATGAAMMFAASAYAQMPTLTHEYAQPGGGSDVSAKNLAEVAAVIATALGDEFDSQRDALAERTRSLLETYPLYPELASVTI